MGLVTSPGAFSLDKAGGRDKRSTNRTPEARKDYLECTGFKSGWRIGANRRGMCASLKYLGPTVNFCQFWGVSEKAKMVLLPSVF